MLYDTDPKRTHAYQKEISGCGLFGLINLQREKVSGSLAKRAICNMMERGNGLGAGFAAYGIYPEFPDLYALHIMYYNQPALTQTEALIAEACFLKKTEEIPTAKVKGVESPLLKRYFVSIRKDNFYVSPDEESDNDCMVRLVMKINHEIDGAYVFSSGKNMGAFKGVGFPDQVADFFRIEEYTGYTWIAHSRFPTNTPGWWGGAHPFTILDWAIVHNGEISSYGINKRYLEMFGYKLTLLTDTEAIAYLLDLLIRRHGLDIETACIALAPPFWDQIDSMEDDKKDIYSTIRNTYGSALLNGPFAILFGFQDGLVGLNDRIKLRPLVAGMKDEFIYMASEEAAIREICPQPQEIWRPKAGEPLIAKLGQPPIGRRGLP